MVVAKVFDLSAVMSRLDNDTQFLHELMKIFSIDHKKYLVALNEAIIQKNSEKVKINSHALKSALGHVGGMSSMELAHTLEKIAIGGDLTEAGIVLKSLEAEIANFLQAYQDWKSTAHS